jgi:hypothetical protein
MIFADLASPVEASNETTSRRLGFAQAGNRYPLFGIMLYPVGALGFGFVLGLGFLAGGGFLA